MTASYNICLIQPEGYAHSAAFAELVEMLHYGLAELGCAATTSVNALQPGARNIVIGAHLLDDAACRALPAEAVVFNFEQMHDSSRWVSPGYLNALTHCEVWDYSERNLEHIAKATRNTRLHFVPVGYAPSLTRIAAAPVQDIDVLFYGSTNERRVAVLDALRQAGLSVAAVFGVYGAERDSLIARAKVVLNMHYYPSSIFEIVRVSYLLANRKAVVAECHDQTEIYPDLRDAVYATDYAGLVEACVTLVRDPVLRKHYETLGFERMQSRNIAAILRPLVTAPAAPSSSQVESMPEVPRRMNLGSGKDWRADYLNVDVTERVKPDLVLDFNQPLPWGVPLPSPRFEQVALAEHYFDLIIANDVLEHLADLVAAMTSCLRLLRAGGELHVSVPYDLSYGAWQDPTHVRAFNERSWLYFTDWFWYLGWSEWRFDLAEQVAVLSPIGKKLQADGLSMDTIMLSPRAVDALQVKLRKRALTVDERALAVRMRNPGRPG